MDDLADKKGHKYLQRKVRQNKIVNVPSGTLKKLKT